MSDYNGWTNWATWHVALLGDNDESLNEQVTEYATKCARVRRGGTYSETQQVNEFRFILWDAYQETVKMAGEWEVLPSLDVNWKEIADSAIEDAERELQYQERNW